MSGHGVLGDGEDGGDLVVPEAAADRVEHLALLVPERGGGRLAGGCGDRHRGSPGFGPLPAAHALDAGPGAGQRTGQATGRMRPVAALESLTWGNHLFEGEAVTCVQ
ncbi:hypothetical protein GCM10010319_32970 [Streptomyces blastmyceticus]|uniref:Uncharacterized protein n=1 Tax=Streptomyces blastmyceticus TaxID=68180 RepID=A0ABN0X251_9ACTN